MYYLILKYIILIVPRVPLFIIFTYTLTLIDSNRFWAFWSSCHEVGFRTWHSLYKVKVWHVVVLCCFVLLLVVCSCCCKVVFKNAYPTTSQTHIRFIQHASICLFFVCCCYYLLLTRLFVVVVLWSLLYTHTSPPHKRTHITSHYSRTRVQKQRTYTYTYVLFFVRFYCVDCY